MGGEYIYASKITEKKLNAGAVNRAARTLVTATTGKASTSPRQEAASDLRGEKQRHPARGDRDAEILRRSDLYEAGKRGDLHREKYGTFGVAGLFFRRFTAR